MRPSKKARPPELEGRDPVGEGSSVPGRLTVPPGEAAAGSVIWVPSAGSILSPRFIAGSPPEKPVILCLVTSSFDCIFQGKKKKRKREKQLSQTQSQQQVQEADGEWTGGPCICTSFSLSQLHPPILCTRDSDGHGDNAV